MWPALLPLLSKALDLVFPDPEKAAEAKARLLELQISGQLAELEKAAAVIQAEASSGNWLAAAWRPLTMLTFVALIVARWLGYTAPGITEALELELLSIIKLGLGGYVIGRSAEKIAPALADALKK